MEKVQSVRHGRFTIRSYGQRLEDGLFVPTFVVTQHDATQSLEIKRGTTVNQSSAPAAMDAAHEAALLWLDATYPES